MPDAYINGRELTYTDSGGDGPPVVVTNASAFVPQLDAFANRYRVISWAPQMPPERMDMWEDARGVLTLLDAVGIERAVLAGAVDGGAVALRAALLAPDRVRALVLVNSGFGGEDGDAVRERLPEIDAPALVVHGDADVDRRHAEQLRAGLPGCREVVAIEDGGATPTLTHPDVVTPAIRAFLDGLPA